LKNLNLEKHGFCRKLFFDCEAEKFQLPSSTEGVFATISTHAKLYPSVPSLVKAFFKTVTSAVGGAAMAATMQRANTIKNFILEFFGFVTLL
jgi:hypothetical protein